MRYPNVGKLVKTGLAEASHPAKRLSGKFFNRTLSCFFPNSPIPFLPLFLIHRHLVAIDRTLCLMEYMFLSGDTPRFPSGTTPRVKHPLEAIPHGIHPQHIRRLLWPESGRFGWRQWSSGEGYMRM
ncbi:hypothetical protein M422DRAFT_251500 [Sphaerobolus stellatus SS14]|uniref:Uncharacterized protein n=1 Tax=Sphaerobolus stellatus (strain SS14) TaxID=990650 RepID=A0A0C9W1N6_SPHS4|nr:hypothetical protein M422DRAFT_251500 [Sphaerobolus stellatus SS14]